MNKVKKCKLRVVVAGFVAVVLLAPILVTRNHPGPGFTSSIRNVVMATGEGLQRDNSRDNSSRVSSSDSVEEIIIQRRSKVMEVCHRIGHVTNQARELSGVMSANLSYCAVQKAGCTMWIRLFKFLHGQNIGSGNPMSINKYQVHNTLKNHYQQFKMVGEEKQFIEHSVRAVTVRDPYTRLWSAYIDKFLLPDFWASKGVHIISLTRANPKTLSQRCGHDVTFLEFIQYVVEIGHSFKYWNQDKHWLPASDICDPCYFKPTIIGKQETFKTDFIYTMEEVGLEGWLKKILSVDHTAFEIKEEIDYTFQIYKRVEKCIDKYELSKRIWTAFILNGYIPANEMFPTNIDHGSLNADSLYELVKSVRSKYTITSEQKAAIRRHALQTAYSQIPKEYMDALKELYKYDFEMFGYDPEPEYLRTS